MSTIKIFIDDLDDAPEALRSLYVENAEGGFKLPIEEKLVPEDKLTRVQKKLDAMKDYVKPDVLQKVKDEFEAYKADTDVDGKVTARIKELQTEWEAEKNDLTGKVSQYENQISQATIKDALTKAATAAGVKQSAIEDVLLRGNTVFKVVEGNLKAFNGAEERFHKGTEAYSPEHFMKELKTSAGHLFEESVGGGALGSVKVKPTTQSAPSNPHDMIAQGLKQGL